MNTCSGAGVNAFSTTSEAPSSKKPFAQSECGGGAGK